METVLLGYGNTRYPTNGNESNCLKVDITNISHTPEEITDYESMHCVNTISNVDMHSILNEALHPVLEIPSVLV